MSVRKLLPATDVQLWRHAKPFNCHRCDEAIWVTYDGILDAADHVIEDARKLAARAVTPNRKRGKRG